MIPRKNTIAGKPAAQYWNDLRAKSLKNKPLKRTAIKKTTGSSLKKTAKPIKKRSKKRAAQERIYAVLRRDYLLDHSMCECGIDECERPSTDIHHPEGREGDRLTDVNNFIALSRECHMKVENNPKWAKELKLSRSRLAKKVEDGTKIEIPEQLK